MTKNSSYINKKLPGLLSGSSLKIIACFSMLVDHIAVSILYYGILLPAAPIESGSSLHTVYLLYRAMRILGRIAFPIFCFLLVEGFLHSHKKKVYAFRLALFSLLSEIPFDLALEAQLPDWSYQNVFFTLLLGFLALMAIEHFQHRPYLQLLAGAAAMGLAELLHTDYSWRGILLILLLYLLRSYPKLQLTAGALSLYWEAPAMAGFIPILFYNGKRGLSLKYVFYAFYPLHLLLLGILRLLFFS